MNKFSATPSLKLLPLYIFCGYAVTRLQNRFLRLILRKSVTAGVTKLKIEKYLASNFFSVFEFVTKIWGKTGKNGTPQQSSGIGEGLNNIWLQCGYSLSLDKIGSGYKVVTKIEADIRKKERLSNSKLIINY